MIKVQSKESKTIYPSLKSVSTDANSNYYLMEVENEQTKRKVAKVINKQSVTDRSVACSLDEVCYRNTGSGYIIANSLSGLLSNGATWSICLWFRQQTILGNTENILFYTTHTTSPSELRVYITVEGKIKLEQYYQKEDEFGDDYNDGGWHRLVLTQNGNDSKIKCYVDGKHIGNSSNKYYMNWDQFDRYGIGADIGQASDYFTGLLKDFQLWDVVLNGDDVKFDYDQKDFLAYDREGSEATARNLKTWYKMSEVLPNAQIHNSANYNNICDNPNDFYKWTNNFNVDIAADVALSQIGFKIADRLTYDGGGNFCSVHQLVTAPIPGQWYFGLWVKGIGSTRGKSGKLNFFSGTASVYVVSSTYEYTGEWQFVQGYVYAATSGTFTIAFDFVQGNEYTALEKGDSVLAYGSNVYNPNYNLDGYLIGSAYQQTEPTPMFDFDDNTFYKYKIYEQTNKVNTDIYDNNVLGLRDEGKLFVQGISQPEYIKQKDADSTNEVYLEI